MLLAISLVFVFIVGAVIGSFLNVAIARLPLEKSLVWPNSRCGACLQPIQWYDNIPLISYLWLRGRCRTCGASYSPAYLFVELGTALGFVGLFWFEVVRNIHRWPGSPSFGHLFPWQWWVGFGWHALLFSFLVVASVCDLKSREIPLQLTLTGTLVGLIGATLMPWPWPHPDATAVAPVVAPQQTPEAAWMRERNGLEHGVYAWPFWGPLPSFCEPGGNWQTGLITGIIGALVGTFLLRTVSFLFSTGLGKEALGLGDADLMMMAGSFLGWQLVVIAFALAVFPALIIGVIQLVVHRDNSLPFGPSLSLGVIGTCLAWRALCEPMRVFFFSGELLFIVVGLCAGSLLVLSFGMRLLRRGEPT